MNTFYRVATMRLEKKPDHNQIPLLKIEIADLWVLAAKLAYPLLYLFRSIVISDCYKRLKAHSLSTKQSEAPECLKKKHT